MTPNPENPAATRARVMVMEAIERHGGTLRSRHGVGGRFTSIHGELGSVANLTELLRGGKKITEVMLVNMPPNFLAPISKLRSEKNVAGFPAPVPPEKVEADLHHEIATLRAENESLRATVVRQATQLAAQ